MNQLFLSTCLVKFLSYQHNFSLGGGGGGQRKISHSPADFYTLASLLIFTDKTCFSCLNYLIKYLNFAFYILCMDYGEGKIHLIAMYLYDTTLKF